MDNEKLIEIVREYTYLYDITDKKYSDNQKKDQAWNAIGMKLKRNGSECKKAWALLRDAFRRSNKKRKHNKSGQNNVLEKKWKYDEEMSFLLPYMKERQTIICPISKVPTIDNNENTDEELDISQSHEARQQTTDPLKYEYEMPFLLPYIKEKPTMCPISKVPAFDNDDNANEEVDIARSPELRHQTFPTTSTPTRTKRIQKRTDETPNTVLMKYIIDSKKNTPTPDDIEQFMAGITTTLRSFPPRDRAIAKAKIFEIVSHMEINILSRHTSNSMVSAPSSNSA